MINVAPIQTFYNKLPRISKVFAYFQSFFINVLTCEVFSDAAVVRVAQLRLVVFMVEQIVDVNIIYVPLYVSKVDVTSLAANIILTLPFGLFRSLFVIR